MDASHVNEAVEAPESLDGRGDHGEATGFARHIYLLQKQMVECVLMRIAVIHGPQIGGADAQSLMQQMIHAGATNAARRARHKDNPTS
jgi:hypothetical protein